MFIRTCQECGHEQEARHPNTYKGDTWRDLKCKKCKSAALDFGKEKVMEKEHTLPSGEIIYMTDSGDHPQKPWQVQCISTEGEVRWSKDFTTQAEAEAEYIRFD